jgi:CheY-like chemotaxis protein
MDEFSGGPDAILMDYVMPRLSGPDATKELRERGFNGMIIGVTGNALPEDIEHFKSKGADAVLTKPIDTEELKRLLAHSRGIRSKRTSNRLNSKK